MALTSKKSTATTWLSKSTITRAFTLATKTPWTGTFTSGLLLTYQSSQAAFSTPIYSHFRYEGVVGEISMHKEAAHKVPVKDYEFTKNMSVDELVLQMDGAWGFTAGKLASAVNIMESMINTMGCVKFLSFTGNLVATGTRGVIRELVKRKLVDVV